MTARHWMITSFNTPIINWNGAEKNNWFDGPAHGINFITFQIEKTPTTEKPHLQGYVEFSNPVRPGGVKRMLLDNGAHIEKRLGTRDEAIKYCQKTDTRIDGPWVWGIPSTNQGKRTDLDEACTMIKRSLDIKDLIDEQPSLFIKYHKGFEKMITLLRSPRTWKTHVFVAWGEPGTGKTRSAFRYHPEAYFLQRGNGKNLWFDGYEDQEVVIIDDFYNTIPYDTMLRLCDRYPCKVEYKGGMREFVARKLIITTNLTPTEIYKEIGNTDAFWRRVSRIVRFRDGQSFETDRWNNEVRVVGEDTIFEMGTLTPRETPAEE